MSHYDCHHCDGGRFGHEEWCPDYVNEFDKKIQILISKREDEINHILRQQFRHIAESIWDSNRPEFKEEIRILREESKRSKEEAKAWASQKHT